LDIPAFIAHWSLRTHLKERTASQSHFNDLCAALNVQSPLQADPNGDFYTFEKGAEKAGGGDGWADVWFRGHFAWEYKGEHADLRKAYLQLLQYKDDLENPPLLIVCDLDRFEVHTNFTGTPKHVYRFSLADLDQPKHLRVLRAVFTNPESLKPGITVQQVTEAAAERFGTIAGGLHARGVEPHPAAHFLVQLLFCLFAEDAGLLPGKVFSQLLAFGQRHPDQFPGQVEAFLTAMQSGGTFALSDIPHFNGGLFLTVAVEPLTAGELRILNEAAALDWSSVEPAIFGTLFERSLDPAKRSQLGAHYTGRPDIERVVLPVVMQPLRRRWDDVRMEADRLKAAWDAASTPRTRDNRRSAFAAHLGAFQDELAAVRILDPACGSGNFLYIALEHLLNLQKEVLTYGATNGLPLGLPTIRTTQVMGLEINEYARELAQVVIWIGYLQWMIGNGFTGLDTPILESLETIRLQDALLNHDDGKVTEATWPTADYIIGNPPFLGSQSLRRELGDQLVGDLFAVYDGILPRESDLCCYFFERAHQEIACGHTKRAGLLATNSIRGGANRLVLKHIKESGDIFMAWDDEPWILEGAAVRISIVGFDDGRESVKRLDGEVVLAINSDLTADTDVTQAVPLAENRGICFQGPVKVGSFELTPSDAARLVNMPINPNGRPNSDVIRPWVNGMDIVRRPRQMSIVDFYGLSEAEAAFYEAPFEHITKTVRPDRLNNRDPRRRRNWWLHGASGATWRNAVEGRSRFLATPRVARYRIFVWLDSPTLPDSATVAIARDDDYFFGVLHSRAHEVWSLRTGTWLGKGNDPRYTPTTCFETFPLPWPPGTEPTGDPRVVAIGEAAATLDRLRRTWLDPEGASEAELKKRTLTNLYNQRPTWLQNAHAALDRAVWDAYGWDDPDPASVEEDTILARLLALNLERAGS